MRLQPPYRPESCTRGFTLIELILVMTLLTIMISLVAPSLAGFFRGRTLDSEARRMLSLARVGQSRAVSEGMPIQLWLDASRSAYGLKLEPVSGKEDPKAVNLAMDGNLHVEAVNFTPPPGTVDSLPRIQFLPDGSIDENSPQMVRLTDPDGTSLWLVESRNHMGYEIRNTDK